MPGCSLDYLDFARDQPKREGVVLLCRSPDFLILALVLLLFNIFILFLNYLF